MVLTVRIEIDKTNGLKKLERIKRLHEYIRDLEDRMSMLGGLKNRTTAISEECMSCECTYKYCTYSTYGEVRRRIMGTYHRESAVDAAGKEIAAS